VDVPSEDDFTGMKIQEVYRPSALSTGKPEPEVSFFQHYVNVRCLCVFCVSASAHACAFMCVCVCVGGGGLQHRLFIKF
jgi:hypothetical protein